MWVCVPEKESDKERQRQGGSTCVCACVKVHIDFEYPLFPPTLLSKTVSFLVPGTYHFVLAGLQWSYQSVHPCCLLMDAGDCNQVLMFVLLSNLLTQWEVLDNLLWLVDSVLHWPYSAVIATPLDILCSVIVVFNSKVCVLDIFKWIFKNYIYLYVWYVSMFWVRVCTWIWMHVGVLARVPVCVHTLEINRDFFLSHSHTVFETSSLPVLATHWFSSTLTLNHFLSTYLNS